MKFFIAFAILAVETADVSHLTNSYLPPAQSTNSAGYTAQAVQQSYSAPANQQTYTTGFVPSVAPNSGYLSSVPETYAAPVIHQTYSAPIAVQQTYSAPVTSYVPSPLGSSAPVVQQFSSAPTFSAQPLGYSTPALQQVYSVPSYQHTYSAPAIAQQVYSAPAGQTTYSAPAITYSTHTGVQPSYSDSGVKVADIGTQYAEDGGYVYKKK